MKEPKEKIKMVFFDSDGVIFDVDEYQETNNEIAISSWTVLFDELGIFPEHERLKNMFIKNEFPSYMEWTEATCKVLLKNGLTQEKFIEVINKRPLMMGAKECIQGLKRGGL